MSPVLCSLLARLNKLLMPREKNDGKGRLGGRAAGTPNKITVLTKEIIQEFVAENYDAAFDAWKAIKNPKQKFEMFLKLLEFIMPRMASVEFNPGDTTPDWMEKLTKLREGK